MTDQKAKDEAFERKPDQNTRNLIYMLNSELKEELLGKIETLIDLQQKSYKNSVDAVSKTELLSLKQEVVNTKLDTHIQDYLKIKSDTERLSKNWMIKFGKIHWLVLLVTGIFAFTFWSKIDSIIYKKAEDIGIEKNK